MVDESSGAVLENRWESSFATLLWATSGSFVSSLGGCLVFALATGVCIWEGFLRSIFKFVSCVWVLYPFCSGSFQSYWITLVFIFIISSLEAIINLI
jgi:hypothetical protein